MVDIIEDGGENFMKILQKTQSKIIEVDNSYIQKFIKISYYLNDQKKNTQKILSLKYVRNSIWYIIFFIWRKYH